ncbi:MAG: hypothetical protein QNJ82_12415, partial [Gammaproteobacteria bacterium]|nr:hypothetical protein [Gammaproteobacteria bacterium]
LSIAIPFELRHPHSRWTPSVATSSCQLDVWSMEGVHHRSGPKEVKHFQLISNALDRLRPFDTRERPPWR